MATLNVLTKYNLHNNFCRLPWQKKEQPNPFIWLTDIDGNKREIPVMHSKYAKPGDLSPVYVSDNMSGKMDDMPSVSTSCNENPTCRMRMKLPGLICEHCFSVDTQEQYDALRLHAKWQYHLFNEFLIPYELFPELDALKIVLGQRGESFGDSGSVIHAQNLIRLALTNPDIPNATWTKNHMWQRVAVEREGKPNNLKLVASSYKLNRPDLIVLDKYTFYDYLFTVWDSEEACEAAGYHICCGSSLCKICRHCYEDGNDRLVNELLKSAQKKNAKVKA